MDGNKSTNSPAWDKVVPTGTQPSQRGLKRTAEEWEAKRKARSSRLAARTTTTTTNNNKNSSSSPATLDGQHSSNPGSSTGTDAMDKEELKILDVVKARSSGKINEIENELLKKEASAKAEAAAKSETTDGSLASRGHVHQKATSTGPRMMKPVVVPAVMEVSSQKITSEKPFDIMDVVQKRASMANEDMEESAGCTGPSYHSHLKDEDNDSPQQASSGHHEPYHQQAEQQPGAYSYTSGEGLRRRDDNCSSLVRIEPGGLGVSNDIEEGSAGATNAATPISLEDNEVSTNALGHLGGDRANQSSPVLSSILPGTNDGDLVTAKPVATEEEEEKEIPEASEFDVDAAKERKQAQSKKTWQKLGGLLVVVLAVVLVIIVATGSHKKDVVELTPSPTISASPSMSPSAAPSNQEEKLLSLLPLATVEAIKKPLTTEKDTPQFLAFSWLMDDPNVTAYSDMRLVQRFALATLFYSTGGPTAWQSYISKSWLDYSLHECEWGFTHSKFLGDFNDTRIETGVADGELWFQTPEYPCEKINGMGTNTTGSKEDQHYTALWVPGANLVGEIPAETFLLTSLRLINIQQNFEIEGTVPTEIGLLSNLERLNLGWRMELGPLPSEIGRCTSLEVLRTHNATGTLPSEYGQLRELRYFRIANSQLTGRLPSEVGLMTKLEILYLHTNGLTGTIPKEFSRMTSLNTMQLNNNFLTGTIPMGITNLSNLLLFSVQANHLTGRIPTEFGTMTQLTDLWVHINELTGSIPTELGNLDMFIFPVLKTQLSGPIPSELGRWTGCYKFVLQDNELTGTIPTELGLMTGLNSFKVFKNRLTGPIPSELGKFTNIDILGLHTNGLTGTIPTELGMLQKAREILLNSNELTGTIPTQLGMLSSVSLLHLDDNALFGTVPSELGGNFTNLESLRLQNNSLTGTVPGGVCRQLEEETAEFLFDCNEDLCGCSLCLCS